MFEKLNCVRLAVAAIAFGVISFAIHMLMVMVMGNAALYEATSQLWKPMGESWFAGALVINLLGGLLFVMAYSALHKCGCACKANVCTNCARCGAMLGFVFWLVVGLPGMLSTYWMLAIPSAIMAEWTVGGFLSMVAGGAAVGLLYKPKK